MSTQRRERDHPGDKTRRWGAGSSQATEGAQSARESDASPFPLISRGTSVRLRRSNGPADVDPLVGIGLGGHKLSAIGSPTFRQLVRPVLRLTAAVRRRPRVRNRAAMGKQASLRSSIPHIPFLPVCPLDRILPRSSAPSPIDRRPRQASAAGRKGTMAKEICISSTPHETRLAILEDDQLAEIYYERENEYTLAGSIYNGRVTRVLPGMQSAFVDLGLERDAFLYVTDFLELEDQEETDELEKAAAAGGNQPPREVRHGNGPRPNARGAVQRGIAADRQERQTAGAPGTARPRGTGSPGRQQRTKLRGGRASPNSRQPRFPRSLARESEGEETGEGGAKRWRGRRRRRGGRGAPTHVADPVESETSAETYLEPSELAEPEVAPEIHAGRAPAPKRSPGFGSACSARRARACAIRASGRVALEVRRRADAGDAEGRACCAPRPQHIQARHADRSSAGVGWQRAAARRIALAASPAPAGAGDGDIHRDAWRAAGRVCGCGACGPGRRGFRRRDGGICAGCRRGIRIEPLPAPIDDTELEPEEQLNTEELVMEEEPEEPLPGAPAETSVPNWRRKSPFITLRTRTRSPPIHSSPAKPLRLRRRKNDARRVEPKLRRIG